MKSVMTHDFSRIPKTAIPRSTFDRGHGLKTAFDSGYLVPIELQEVLPGDTVDMDATLLGRLPSTVTPIMDNVFLDTHWFFVPSRLLWTNFVKMMGERVNPKDSIDYLVPQLDSGSSGFAVGSLADYFGIPTDVPHLKVNALPFRAYAKIWDDWYRDENLQDSIIQSSSDLGDSNGTIAWNTLLKRGKRHDYFTSCLPWPQKGDGVEMPLGGLAPVQIGADPLTGSGNSFSHTFSGDITFKAPNGSYWLNSGSSTNTPNAFDSVAAKVTDGKLVYEQVVGGSKDYPTRTPASGSYNVYADLTSATAATINSLRMAFQLQRLLETDARSGTRYCELLAAHFKTICPDARLQRSEYLGGSSDRIVFAPIAQTSETTADGTPQGNLVAQPKVVAKVRWSKSFTEHGYLLGFVSVRCDLNYQQGLNRLWSRRGRYDFFWPTLQHLGEQAVLNREIFAQGDDIKDSDGNVVDEGVFGYQERFAEYRYNPSIITGKMRSTATDSLDVWHLAQQFAQLPTLSAEFIEESPPLSRVLSVTDEPQVILDAFLGQKWTRPMSTYSIPGLIDHL